MLFRIFYIWIPTVLGILLVVFLRNGALLFGESVFLLVLIGLEYARRSDTAMTLRAFTKRKIGSIVVVVLLMGMSLSPVALKIISISRQ